MEIDLGTPGRAVSTTAGSVRHMRVDASPAAEQLIAERGGSLYVWLRRAGCCGGGITVLETASEPPDRPFTQVASGAIDVFLDARVSPPGELAVEVRGIRRKRICAYWNGCAYVV